jgi:hypothetical protein
MYFRKYSVNLHKLWCPSNPFLCLFICQSVSLSFWLLFICVSPTYSRIHPSIHPSFSLAHFMCLSVCRSVDLSVCRSVYMFMFLDPIWNLYLRQWLLTEYSCLCSTEGKRTGNNFSLVFENSYSHATFSDYPPII